MPLVTKDSLADGYDVVIGGTGFGSLFFLHGLMKAKPDLRVLLLERGDYRDTAWQIEHQRNGTMEDDSLETYEGKPGEKPWWFTIGYGGGTNCWTGNTPRMLPSDFRLKSTYGVGEDWPISYDDLEPFYVEAEEIMNIAGPDDIGLVYPRSKPFPQPPHRLSTVDRMLKAAMPDRHFALPTARLSRAVGDRAPCCNSVQCRYCPTGAKFTALNSFGALIDMPGVHVLTGAQVLAAEIEAGVARGLRYAHGGREHVARGDLVAVGCNGIHTPFVLMRSGLSHPALGRYLHEKRLVSLEVYLDGVDHFDGGSLYTGCNVSLLDGEHRREAAGALIMIVNNFKRDGLRTEFGRWRQVVPVELLVEDLPQEANGVFDGGGDKPVVTHASRSAYNEKGVERALALLPEVLAPLPVEKIVRHRDHLSAYHVQGTCRMGADPATSVVDGGLVHHEVRNLMVLGTAVWATCTMSNPSLTAAALSLRAAKLIGGAKWHAV